MDMQHLIDLLGPNVQIIQGPTHLDAGHRVLDPQEVPKGGRFALGLVWITPGVSEMLDKHVAAEEQLGVVKGLLERHARGDWGSLNQEDRESNNRNVERGGGAVVLSEYLVAGNRVWVHGYVEMETTVLLPEEY